MSGLSGYQDIRIDIHTRYLTSIINRQLSGPSATPSTRPPAHPPTHVAHPPTHPARRPPTHIAHPLTTLRPPTHSPHASPFCPQVMIYEGVGNDGKHRLGLATSSDGGASWGKYEGAGMREPGGPVFECGAEGAWDDGNVGTPWLTCLPEGGYRLYYVGTSDTGRTVAIGAADR